MTICYADCCHPLAADPVYPAAVPPRQFTPADEHHEPVRVRIDRWTPAGLSVWAPCSSRRIQAASLVGPIVGVPCSLRDGHSGRHEFPLIRIRSRYGVIRAVCHLCDWSTTTDLTRYPFPAWMRDGIRQSALGHLQNFHR